MDIRPEWRPEEMVHNLPCDCGIVEGSHIHPLVTSSYCNPKEPTPEEWFRADLNYWLLTLCREARRKPNRSHKALVEKWKAHAPFARKITGEDTP
jgi:hypothetical protein